ncbi:hypothetical protein E2320_022276 [Naja naja]|nr:hypothetical protein E2320_022276 [Naja naja]
MSELTLPRAQQVQTVQHVYPAEVQYIEGGEAVYANGTLRTTYTYNTEAQIYAPGSATAYFEPQGGSAQVSPGASSSPTAIPSHGMVGLALDSAGTSQIVTSSGTYLIHGGLENARHMLSHTSRSSPATLEMAIENLQKNEGITSHKSTLLNSHQLQWLLDNYETAEGVSLPRSSLYNHYLRHCQEHKLDPVNAASFGKLIRSDEEGNKDGDGGRQLFLEITHYPPQGELQVPLLWDPSQAGVAAEPLAGRRPVHGHEAAAGPPEAEKLDGATEGGAISAPHTTPEESVAAQCQHHQQYIDVTHVLPEFPVLNPESVLLQGGIETRDLQALQLFYRRHCEALLPSLCSEESYEAILPRHQLIALCKHEPILAWMRSCDHLLYQTLVEILIPDVLRPVPGTLTQAIRNFAKSLEGWLMSAMSEFPQPVVQSKVSVVSAFAQTLRRYTSLNHLAQAARAVLQNTSQINQMLSDLNRVDFANVQCEEGLVQKLEHDFKVTLQHQSSLDQWARWLGEVVSQVLKPHEGAASFPRAARQFLLKWSFYRPAPPCLVSGASTEPLSSSLFQFSDLASLSPAVLEKDAFSTLGPEAGARMKPRVKREHSDPGPSLQEI